MDKFGVQLALEGVAEARHKWNEARREFQYNIDRVVTRLLHEAAVNYMSPEQIAKAADITPKRVRTMMREAGLNPRDGKRVLADTAATALAENAALLGIHPSEMDLMSPLAYLPMGSELRQQLTDATTSQVHEDTVLVRIDRETWEEHVENGECPVSSACCGCHLDGATAVSGNHDAAYLAQSADG